MKKWLRTIDNTEWGHRILQDPLFRALITSTGSMGWNLIYALFNGVLAIVYHSFWFISMFVYYAVLGFMKMLVVTPKKGQQKEKWTDSRIMKVIGIGMVFIAIAVSGIVCMGIAEKRNPSYHIIVMITIATYTFYVMVITIISIVKARRKKDKTMIMLRNISLASAIVALLALERSMLGTFGDANDAFSFVMQVASGAAVFILITGIGISMVIQSKS